MTSYVTAYLGLGSNIGNRTEQIEHAIDLIQGTSGIRIMKCSSIYKTEPIGYTDQPEFYNSVIQIQTSLQPNELLSVILNIEKKLDRIRTIRWGPRTIDIDILMYGNQIVDEPHLKIPHIQLTKRAFVLVPLLEIAGSILVPGTTNKLTYYIEQLEDQKIDRIDERSFALNN